MWNRSPFLEDSLSGGKPETVGGELAAYAIHKPSQAKKGMEKRGMNRMNRKGIYEEVPKILAPSLTFTAPFL